MKTIEKSKIRVIRSNAEVFHDYVQAHLWARRPLPTRAGKIDSIKDFADICFICEMIMTKKPTDLIENKFNGLDTDVRKAFPLTIFNRNGKLRS